MKSYHQMTRGGAFLALAFSAVGFAATAQAGEEVSMTTHTPPPAADNIWTRDTLTGEWCGLRPDLEKHGIDIDLRLSQYFQGVSSGGAGTGFEYGGTMDYRLNVDAEKLFGAKGLSFNMHARTRYGNDINSRAGALILPNAGMMMPAPGDYNGTNITGATATYMFPFFAEREGVITLGMLDVIDTLTGFFPNISYGQEGFSNVNVLASNMPWFGAVQGLSLWGGMMVTIHPKYKIPESGFMFTGTVNESTSWGSVQNAFDDGVWLAGFHRFIWEVDDNMGYFMVFAGTSTKSQASNDPNDFIEIPGQGIVSTDQEKPWDIALYFYQDIWKSTINPDRKANVFFGGTIGPDNPQFAQWNVFGNIEVFGLMDCRPHDRMGVGGWFNGLSSNFKDLVSDEVKLGNTWGVELYYNYELTPWSHMKFDLQLAQNQNRDDDFAIIPGVSMVIDF